MLVSEFGGDDVNPRHGGEVGDLAGAIFQVLCLDVHFAGAFHGQRYAAITCNTVAQGCCDSNSSGRGNSVHVEKTLTLEIQTAISREQKESNCGAPDGESRREEQVKDTEKSRSEVTF